MQNVSNQLGMHSADLQSRYIQNMAATLAMTTSLLNRNEAALGSQKLAGMRSELDGLSSAIRNRSQLSSADMDGLSARLGNVANQLAASHLFESRLQNVEADLGAVARNLQSRSLSNRDMDAASSTLDSAARQLNAESSLGSISMENRVAFFSAISAENRSVDAARSQLGSMLGSRLNSRDMASRVESISSDLSSRASDLESRAVDDLQSRLNSNNALASSFLHMQASPN